MTTSDGSFCLPFSVCLFVVCVFIGSSASHISLQGWNSLSGTVFPRVLYLKYSFVGFIFFGYVCVCVRNMLLELCSFCPAAFVAFFLEYLLSGLTQREFSWERWAVDQLAITNFLELVHFFRGFRIEQRNISQCKCFRYLFAKDSLPGTLCASVNLRLSLPVKQSLDLKK